MSADRLVPSSISYSIVTDLNGRHLITYRLLIYSNQTVYIRDNTPLIDIPCHVQHFKQNRVMG